VPARRAGIEIFLSKYRKKLVEDNLFNYLLQNKQKILYILYIVYMNKNRITRKKQKGGKDKLFPSVEKDLQDSLKDSLKDIFNLQCSRRL